MPRHFRYGVLDTPQAPAGDVAFLGVNMRLEPHMLQPGFVSEAVNMRFSRGVAETRKGFVTVPWVNRIVDGHIVPWVEVHGAGIFSDPTTAVEFTILAADGKIYFSKQNNAPREMGVDSSQVISGTVEFVQCFNVMLMFRGTEAPPLFLDSIDGSWKAVSDPIASEDDEGNDVVIQAIPNATHGIFFQNRLLVPTGNDEIAVSLYGDYTSYLPFKQEFKINQGSADRLVAIYKFNDTTLIAFKEHSIYAVANVYGNLAALQQDELTNQFGLVARKSIAHVGKDLWFLSELGVMSIAQTEQNKLQSVVIPVSEPIQPVMDLINWKYAGKATAAYWNNRYYLAVPVGDAETFRDELIPVNFVYDPALEPLYSVFVTPGHTYRYVRGPNEVSLTNGTQTLTESGDFIAQGLAVIITGMNGLAMTASVRQVFKGVNNRVLVYDFLNGAWCGWDEAPGLEVKQFFIAVSNNVRRLFYVGEDGYSKLYEEDYKDQVSIPYVDILIGDKPIGDVVIVVNGGTSVLSGGSIWNQAGGFWGASNTDFPALNGQNLFHQGGYGFYQGSRNEVWTAPNTNPIQITDGLGHYGVRFYATNGVLPDVVYSDSPTGTATVTAGQMQEIAAYMITRGYMDQDLAYSAFDWVSVDIQTWHPNYSISVVTEGVEETFSIVLDRTRSRTKYTTAHTADFIPTNINGDFKNPKREDYSVALGTDAVQAGNPTTFRLGDGAPIDRHQEAREERRIVTSSRYAQVKISNDQGRIRVMGVRLESRKKQTKAGTRV